MTSVGRSILNRRLYGTSALIADAVWKKVIEDISEMPEVIRCKDCKSWGRLVTYKDGSTMIDCKRGRSMDPEGYCHLAELRGDSE